VIPDLEHVNWTQTYRLVSTRHPTVDLFERIAPPSDWAALIAIEGLTNDRLRDEVGDLSLVPVEHCVSGKGASVVMAPFTHCGPSRFSAGAYGLYYAAKTFETALREVAHHRARFLRNTREPPATVGQFRTYVGAIDAHLHDCRGDGWKHVHDPDDLVPAQELGRTLRSLGSAGVVYRSVRAPGGECFGAFRPNVVAIPVQGQKVDLDFDGERVHQWKPCIALHWIPL
jgi:RES domain-containing protein